IENNLLLLAGLGLGGLAALVAVAPHLVTGTARLATPSLLGTLLLVLAVGGLAGRAAVKTALRAPLLPALRGD
ncbi:MAG: hypothetical protein GTO03_01135, partial [Planctomycetales bacterium]|nr:hypothetical protein [Planctomycetales bacterium]